MAQEELLPLLQSLAKQNGQELFLTIENLANEAPDFHQVLEELIRILHKIALTQVVPSAFATENHIVDLANEFTPEDVQIYYQIALLGRRDLGLTPSPQQGFEMTMLRMLAFTANSSKSEIALAPKIEKIAAPPVTVKKESINLPEWRHLLPKLELSGMAYALASNCTLEKFSENKIELALSENHVPMLNTKLKERIAEALSRHLAKPVQLEIHIYFCRYRDPQQTKTARR